jgi:hypothetical protein
VLGDGIEISRSRQAGLRGNVAVEPPQMHLEELKVDDIRIVKLTDSNSMQAEETV